MKLAAIMLSAASMSSALAQNQNGQGCNGPCNYQGAPGPLVGAGLPALAIGIGYAFTG